MAKTLALPKDQLVKQALTQMQKSLADNTWTDRQKLALTCRILNVSASSANKRPCG